VDLGVESLTEHLLLLVGRSGVESVGVKTRASGKDHGSGHGHETRQGGHP